MNKLYTDSYVHTKNQAFYLSNYKVSLEGLYSRGSVLEVVKETAKTVSYRYVKMEMTEPVVLMKSKDDYQNGGWAVGYQKLTGNYRPLADGKVWTARKDGKKWRRFHPFDLENDVKVEWEYDYWDGYGD